MHYTFLWQNYLSKHEGLVIIWLPRSDTINVSCGTQGEIKSRYPDRASVAFQDLPSFSRRSSTFNPLYAAIVLGHPFACRISIWSVQILAISMWHPQPGWLDECLLQGLFTKVRVGVGNPARHRAVPLGKQHWGTLIYHPSAGRSKRKSRWLGPGKSNDTQRATWQELWPWQQTMATMQAGSRQTISLSHPRSNLLLEIGQAQLEARGHWRPWILPIQVSLSRWQTAESIWWDNRGFLASFQASQMLSFEVF